ncbi:MAG: diguanylate cyclase [Chloroflexi bacterium]|nr:diguanylate cyclase [Chloroflexota bacterium]
MIALVYLSASLIFQGVSAQSEVESMTHDLVRLRTVWDDALASLDDIAKDWATWDDAYAFVVDRNTTFEDANLLNQTFQNLRVDVIVFFDTAGQPVFSKAYDTDNQRPIAVPPELLAAFGPGSPLLQTGGRDSRLLGPLITSEAPLLISAHPILKSTGAGPSRGTLVMARHLDSAQIERLARATQLAIGVYSVTQRDPPADVAAARVTLDDRTPEHIAPLDAQTQAGYLLLPDIRGQPAFILRATTPRSLRALSGEALNYFLLALALVGAGTIGILLWQLESRVLQPLARIGAAVGQVSRAADSSARVPVVGDPRDEIAQLAVKFNTALAALDQSHRALAESEARYRQLAETVPDVVYTLGLSERGELVIETLNPAFERVTGFPRDAWLGRSIAELVHPDDLPRALSMFGSADNTTYNLRIHTRDGGYRIGSFSSATRVKDGVPIGSMGIGRDVTDRLRLEAMFQAVAVASERFLRSAEWQREINTVLSRLGMASEVSRIVLSENDPQLDGEVLTSPRYEWCGAGIAPQIGNPDRQTLPMRAGGLKRWVEVLARGEPISGQVRDFPASEQAVLEAEQARAMVVMPIFAGGAWWGFISFSDGADRRDFQALEQEALRTFASALGAAIHRSAIEEERARDRHYLALINEVTHEALTQPDARAVAQLLADKLHEFISSDGCYVTLWDELHQVPVPTASAGGIENYAQLQSNYGEMSLTEAALRHRGPLNVPDLGGSGYASERLKPLFPSRSVLALPLLAGSQWLGAALIAFNTTHEFSRDEIDLGEQVAEQFSLILARLRLLAESNRRAGQLKALHETAMDVSASRDAVGLLEKIVQRATALLDSESGGLYLADAEARTVRCVVSYNTQADYRGIVLKFGEGAAGQVAETAQPLIIDDYSEWSGRARTFESDRPFGAVLSVPLAWRGQVTGVVHVLGHGRRYTPADIELLGLFAEQASVAVENARLFGEVERLAITDDLTGVYNRRQLMTILDREVLRARRLSHPLALLIADLDHFKNVNDQHGHAAGDLALRAFCERLRAKIRGIDTLARYGGEEFVVVMPETHAAGAQVTAERLRQAIAAEPFQVGTTAIALTASIGVAVLSADDSGGDSMLARADSALYDAKGHGRNRVVIAA